MKKLKAISFLLLFIGVLSIYFPIDSGNTTLNTNDTFVGKEIENEYYLDIPYLIEHVKIVKDETFSFDKNNEENFLYFAPSINIENNNHIILYGSSKKEQELPFNFLESYLMNVFFEENAYLYFTKDSIKERYRIFSVYQTNTLTFDFNNLDNLQNKSLYAIHYKFQESDKTITLVTNSLETENKYIVLHAVKISEETSF